MPGIYGYVKNFNEASQIENMGSALNYAKQFVQDATYKDESIEASKIHLGKMALRSEGHQNKGVFVWVEGESYNTQNAKIEEILLDAYLANGLDVRLKKIDGYFNAVIYDSIQKKVFLMSDRYGMRMLYYYIKDGRFAWAGEVKGLLPLDFVDKAINTTSLSCFMDLGYLLEENTWHKYIKLIPPATIIEFDLKNQKTTQKYYWKWSEIKPSEMGFDEAVDALGHLFLNSVKKRFNPNQRMGISLSGGLDSRAIFAAANKLFPAYEGHAYTFGIKNCDDIKIAKQVTSRSKWKHKIFYFNDKNWYFPRFGKIYVSDGMLNMMHMHGSEFLDVVSVDVDFNLNGYAGDVVLGGGWVNKIPLNSRATKNNLSMFYKNHINLCNIENDFYDINHGEPHLYMNRVRRFTNMGTVSGLCRIDQRKPFFDNDIMELVYSLPDDYRAGAKLYSAMLLKFFPEFFVNIPWQRTGRVIGDGATQFCKTDDGATLFHKAVVFGKRVFRKFGLHANRSTKYYTDYANWIKDDAIAKELRTKLQRDDSVYQNFTEIDFEKEYLEPHLQGQADYSEKILGAATVEIYLRNVFGTLKG